jgi:hypothetical protein
MFWDGLHWCGKACKSAVTRPLANCSQCGNQHRRRRRSLQSGRSFCSQECWHEFKKSRSQHRICADCGNQLLCSPKRLCQERVFCGPDCVSSFYKKNRADAAVRKDQPKPKARRGPKPCLDWMKYGDWGPVWKRLRNTKRQEVSDPWLAKFEGMVRGWRAREKDVARPRITRSKASRDTWELAFPIMRSHARGRARTAGLMLSDPWKRKFETMSRNWRRKHLHRSREKHESV